MIDYNEDYRIEFGRRFCQIGGFKLEPAGAKVNTCLSTCSRERENTLTCSPARLERWICSFRKVEARAQGFEYAEARLVPRRDRRTAVQS